MVRENKGLGGGRRRIGLYREGGFPSFSFFSIIILGDEKKRDEKYGEKVDWKCLMRWDDER